MPKLKFQFADGRVVTCSSQDEFPSESCYKVDMIDARKCGLKWFDPTPFRNVEVILLSENQLPEFPDFHKNKKLRFLQIHSNLFNEISPKHVPELLSEAIIDDLGFKLYPLAQKAAVKVYRGYGGLSGNLRREQVEQMKNDYFRWRESIEKAYEPASADEESSVVAEIYRRKQINACKCKYLDYQIDRPEISLRSQKSFENDAPGASYAAKAAMKNLSLTID